MNVDDLVLLEVLQVVSEVGVNHILVQINLRILLLFLRKIVFDVLG